MISIRDLSDLLDYDPYTPYKIGDLGEYKKLLRRCAEDFLEDPSQETRILEEIEDAVYLIEPRRVAMRHTLERIKIEAKAIQKGW